MKNFGISDFLWFLLRPIILGLPFIFAFVATVQLGTMEEIQESIKRDLASTPSFGVGKTCAQLVEGVFNPSESLSLRVRLDQAKKSYFPKFENFFNSKRLAANEKIDSDDIVFFIRKREEFLGLINESPQDFWRQLDAGNFLEFSSERTVALESLALIQALDFSLTGQRRVLNSAHVDLLERFSGMLNSGKLRPQNLDDIISQWLRVSLSDSEHYSINVPLYARSSLLFSERVNNSRRDRILRKIIMHDILKKGLDKSLKNYRILQSSPGFFSRFNNSDLAKIMKTSFFNLPVLYGMPPLYLPGRRPLSLSSELATRLFERGLTRELSDDILEYWRLQGPIWNLSSSEFYEVIRPYYILAASSYFTLTIYLDLQSQLQDISNERDILQEVESEITTSLENAYELESRGFSIFESSNGSELNRGQNNVYCSAIRSCFEIYKNETGEIPRAGSNEYQQCKEFMDPDGACLIYP